MDSHQVGHDGHTNLAILNPKRAVLPGPDLLHRLISTAVSEEVAIDFLGLNQPSQHILYAQLRRHTLSLARVLLAEPCGFLGRQQIIPVMMPQCPELYISYLAILEVGAAFCPISPDVPLERLKFIISDVDASLVLTMHSQYDKVKLALPERRCMPISIRDLEDTPEPAADGHCSFQPPRSNPSDAAYVMYTSGSTGVPKGVKVSHQSVTQSLLAHDEHIPKFKRFLQFASPTFDVSVFEIFFPFFRGATLVCCEREVMLADLPGTMQKLEVDAAELTPTVARTLLRSRKAVPDLKILLTIGEMLNQHVVDEFGGSDARDSILYAMYGPTEASIHCTVAPRLAAGSSVKNIGFPLSTVTAFILADSQGSREPEVLTFGQVGELAIGGQLATGYLNRPEQTAAAFINLAGYGQVYRTGDRALMPKDGEIQILGRISTGQVKLRGQRVELGEVEDVACKTSAVEIAVASVFDEALVLFCSGGDKLSIQDVQSTCVSWLPGYMRPTDILLLPEMPRLPSGKIDRKALDDVYRQRSEENSPCADTFTDEMELAVARCLQYELNTPIGPRSILRSVGLDSLRAIRIAAALRPKFPQISTLLLLEADTIHDLAERLKVEARTNAKISHPNNYEDSLEWRRLKLEIKSKFKAEGLESLVEDVVPCTSLQIAMLGETAMNEMMNFTAIELELNDRVRMENLEQALRRLADKNEILRSGFVGTIAHEMPFVQVVWSDFILGHGLDLSHPFQIIAGHDENHVLVKLHHALYDGWSWDLLVSDLHVLLNQGIVAPRPSFRQYRRYMEAYQRAHAKPDQQYWLENMRQASLLSIPDLGGSREQTYVRQSCKLVLSTTLQTLDEVAVKCRISRQTILQAAMVLLLSAYCDTLDILCGVVVSGREKPFPGIEQLIGPCLSTYPLRIDLSSVETIQDLLSYVYRQQSACLRHSSITLSQIQQVAGVQPTERLFDALCVWQDDLKSSPISTLIKTTDTEDTLAYSVVLEAEPQAETVLTKLTFDASKVPFDQAELMLKQIDSIVAFLTTREISHLEQSWASMQLDVLSVILPTSGTLDCSFDLTTTIVRLAKEDPQRTAVEFIHDFDIVTGQRSTEILTYRLLYNQGTKMARNLISGHQIQPNDLVCIILDKSVNLYVSILAVILSGGGYLCLDPRSPDERIRRTLGEAGCKLIITDDSDRIESFNSPVRCRTTSPKALIDVSNESVKIPTHVNCDALAYAVFTSGSTGTPKGVLLTRKNLLSHINQVSRLYPHQSRGAKLLQACSQAFDVSVFEIFWTWHAGMTLCSASNDVIFRDLEKFIDVTAVTHLSMTPSVAALVTPTNVPKVKFLVTAGEPMNSKVFHSWSDHCLFQGYGPSETTNICNVRPWVSSNDQMNNTGPAFANTSLFVCRRQETNQTLNEYFFLQPTDFVPLPRGAVGEIWIGGDQVGRGYIDPNLTARSFLNHPEHGRLYRSGDIGRLLADDSLVVLGREDGQVKLRGQRIELGDINLTLVQHEHVEDAITLIVDKLTNARLVTFYVLQQTHNETTNNQNVALYEWLQDRLPSYMIPDMLFPTDIIPLTRQGKVDYGTIMNTYEEMTADTKIQCSRYGGEEDNEEEPSTEIEIQIAQALSDITNTPLSRIWRTSSFFGLGLDSISSIRLAQRLRKDGLGIVDVSTILKHPSIVRLIGYLQGGDNMEHITAQKEIDNLYDDSWQKSIRSDYRQHGYQIDKILPCTPLQEAMLSSTDGDHEAYYNSLTFQIHGDLEAMYQAWVVMVERHDLLRTAFVESRDLAKPYAQIVLKTHQLHWDESGRHNACHKRVGGISLPAYHIRIMPKDTKDQALLKLNIHHALYDAEAMTLLLRDIEHTVKGKFLPAPISFGGYLNYMINLSVEDTDSFWSTLLKAVRPSRLENIMSSVAKRSSHSSISRRNAHLSLNLLASHAKSNETTLASLLQTSLARLLACYTQADDICFGNVFSGRNIAVSEVPNIVGPCFNTLPLRARIKKNTSIKSLSQRLYQDSLDIIPFQTSSLRRIQKQHSKDGRALFDVLLLIQQQRPELDSTIWDLVEETGDMIFPYIFEATPNKINNTLELALHCQHYDSASTNTLLEHFDTLLGHTVMFPQALASDFSSIQTSLPDITSVTGLTNGPISSNGVRSFENERPWSPTEIMIRDVLHDLTKIEKSRMNFPTTIFKLGLDSINAVLIASKLRALGFEISSGDILEGPSIEEIAKSCDARESPTELLQEFFDIDAFYKDHHEAVTAQLSVDDEQIEDILPCTATQSGILTQFINSRGELYYNRSTIPFHKSIDLPRLRLAWVKLTQRHQILRTGFVPLDNSKHPFAMVVYVPETYPLPLRVGEITRGDPVDDAEQLIDHLERPAWEIVISSGKEHLIMDIWILHALYDATSIRIMLGDLEAIYDHCTLAPAPDWKYMLSKHIHRAQDSKEAKQFWLDTGDCMEITRFPDLNVYHTKDQNLYTTVLSSSISQHDAYVKCAELDVGLQSICQVAWARLLAAYTGQAKVTFGVILSGRTSDDEQENKISLPCINTVPFAIELEPKSSSFLRKVSRWNASCVKYQFTPLNTIKRWNSISGELFDTVLVLQKLENTLSGSSWAITGDEASAEFAVSIEVIPDINGHLEMQLTYRKNVIPQAQAHIMLKEYEAMLVEELNIPNSVESPYSDSRNSLLSVLPPHDDLISTQTSFLHQFVTDTSKIYPNKTALEFVLDITGENIQKQSWTYAELDARGNQYANLLLKYGVKVGDLVAVCFDKCPEASFSILGVLKAGCSYVAIDPGAPVARKSFILEDAGCKIVLTTSDKADNFKHGCVSVIDACKTGNFDGISHESPVLNGQLTSDDTCYCLYTSGTTGTPKGCLISHRSAVQAMMSFQRIFQDRWTEDSRWLQFASFHFDVSVLEQYWSWSVGICVTSAPRDLLFEDLPGIIDKLGITHLDLTPSLARLLNPSEVPQLRDGVFIVGGEQIRQDVLDTWTGIGCLYNFYGPSEVTIGCTVHPQVEKNVKPTNIGQQWDNVGTFVLEPHTSKPVIRGAIGELCLSGPLVGKGYLNRPELTSEKFTTIEGYNTRIYRTGDLVRLLHDDSFDFLGRIDDQVKLRGQRLEIGEINHVLVNADEEVKDVSTLVLSHPQQEKEQLIGFFTTSSNTKQKNAKPLLKLTKDSKTIVERLKLKCTEHLPLYMIPTHFLEVEFMPLNINNKTDNKILKTLYNETSAAHLQGEDGNEEKTLAETPSNYDAVVKILASFFVIDRCLIKPTSRLFELGLDSISVIALSRIMKREGFPGANMSTIMASSIVANLAKSLIMAINSDTDTAKFAGAKSQIEQFAMKHAAAFSSSLRVTAGEIEHIAPCTSLQEGMISKVLSSNSIEVPYFAVFTYKLDVDVDIVKLQTAWKRVSEYIDILRTYFLPTEDGYAQVVLKKFKMHALCLFGAINLADIEDAFHDWILSARNFGRSLPWQVCFTQGDNHERCMSLFMFHGLYDGLSLPLLLEVVKKEYQGSHASMTTVPKFYEVLPYGLLRSQNGAKEFWREQITKVELLNIRPLKEKSLRSPSRVTVDLCLSSIGNLCAQLNVTRSAIFLASWLHTLQNHYAVNPTIGLVLSGRALEIENVDKVIGPLFNTVPCSISRLETASSLFDFIKACQEFSVRVMPHQHTSVREINKWLKSDTKDGLFDSLFVFMNDLSTDCNVASRLWSEVGSTSTPDYPLNFEVRQIEEGRYTVTIVAVKNERLEKTDIDMLLDIFTNTLRSLDRGDELNLREDLSTGSLAKSVRAQNDNNEPISDKFGGNSRWNDVTSRIGLEISDLAGVEMSEVGLQSPTFFELGLDSIDALKLAARLKNANLTVPVSKIMQFPTVTGIAAYVHSSVSKQNESLKSNNGNTDKHEHYMKMLEEQGMSIDHIEAILDITPMQEGLLLDFKKYYHTLVYKVHAGTDVRRLSDAIERVVYQLPVLRSIFVAVEDVRSNASLVQLVQDANNSQFTVAQENECHDVSWVVNRLKHLANEAELSGQQFTATITKTLDESRILFLGMPHALYDGWSIQLIHSRIRDAYHNRDQPVQPASHILAHVDATKFSASSQANKDFWFGTLQSARSSIITIPVELNSLHPSSLLQQASKVSLDNASKICRDAGVTLQSVGLTCWTSILAFYTRSLDTIHGIVLSGRTTEGSDELVFPTFNTVCFRNKLEQNVSRIEMLKKTHGRILQTMEHQQFPLKEALKLSGFPHEQLFNTLFTFQKSPTKVEKGYALYEEHNIDEAPSDPPYAINIEMTEKEGQIWWTIAVQEGVASVGQVQSVLEHLDQVFEALHKAPLEPFLQPSASGTSICGLGSVKLRTETPKAPGRPVLMQPSLNEAETEFTDLELTIRDVLAQVSKTDPSTIKRDAGLFHLGLDSISAIKVSSLLKKEGIRLPVSDLVSAQNIGQMAKVAGRQGKVESIVNIQDTSRSDQQVKEMLLPEIGIPKDSVETILLASAGQIYMLKMWQASKGRLFYASFWFEVHNTSPERLSTAFATLKRQVPAMRTTFVEHKGQVYAVVLGADSDGTDDELPWSYDAVEDQGRLLVCLKIHHALYDAISLHLIISALQDLCQNDQVTLNLYTDSRPFLQLVQNMNKQAVNRRRQFWTEYLSGDSNEHLKGSGLIGSFECVRLEKFMPKIMSIKNLTSTIKRKGIGMQALFFAVYARVHARLTMRQHARDGITASKSDHVKLGIYLANRSLDLEDLPSLSVPTFNIVPLKVSVDEAHSLADVARQVRNDLQEISKPEHCGASLQDIFGWTGVRLDVFVNFLKMPDEADEQAVFEEHAINFKHAEGETLRRAQVALEQIKSKNHASPFLTDNKPSTSRTEEIGVSTDSQWCMPAVDIEARITKDGDMAMGVFAPGDMLDEHDLDVISQDVKDLLYSVQDLIGNDGT